MNSDGSGEGITLTFHSLSLTTWTNSKAELEPGHAILFEVLRQEETDPVGYFQINNVCFVIKTTVELTTSLGRMALALTKNFLFACKPRPKF